MYLHLVGSQKELFEDQTELMFDDDIEGFLYRVEDFYDGCIMVLQPEGDNHAKTSK